MQPIKKKKSRRTIELREGCYCTPLKVTPANWDKAGASVRRDWQIWYRFYDPLFKDHPKYGKGKLVPIKGMNHVHTLAERRDITAALMDQELDKLRLEGWNPIRKVFMPDAELVESEPDYIIPPTTGLAKAMQQAFDRLCVPARGMAPEMIINLRSCPKYFLKAVSAAGQQNRPLEQVKRRHLVMIWEQLAIVKGNTWTDNNHNFYRSHISMIFEELFAIEAIETVPMGSIKPKMVAKKVRETLTMEQRVFISNYLRAENYQFWRFMQIFFHSGARTTELLAIRKGDVDFEKMQVRYIVKKGKWGTKKPVYRPVKDIAYGWWREAVKEAVDPEDYLFSVGLKPGERTIRREQISRRWRLWVKQKLTDRLEQEFGITEPITADWYSLRYSNTTEVVEHLDKKEAMKLTGHTTPRMIDEVYDVNKTKRENERVRKVGNAFA